jgi:hypothetical protein
LFYKNVVAVAVWEISGACPNLLSVMVIGYQILFSVSMLYYLVGLKGKLVLQVSQLYCVEF